MTRIAACVLLVAASSTIRPVYAQSPATPFDISLSAQGKPFDISLSAQGKPFDMSLSAQGKPLDTGASAQGKPLDTGASAQGKPFDTGASAQGRPNMVETPSVKVLTGLTVPQFEQEMQHFVQAIGVTCGGCHMPRGNFASDENPRKLKAREMIEMTKALNKQFFDNHKPAEGESVLGRVTCYTCHQGETKPKSAP